MLLFRPRRRVERHYLPCHLLSTDTTQSLDTHTHALARISINSETTPNANHGRARISPHLNQQPKTGGNFYLFFFVEIPNGIFVKDNTDPGKRKPESKTGKERRRGINQGHPVAITAYTTQVLESRFIGPCQIIPR